MLRDILLLRKKDMSKIVFRIDDIGASTKHFNQHGRKHVKLFGKIPLFFPFANIGFFKRMEPFRGWAKYDEVTTDEWKKFLVIFSEQRIVPIIAITACWVERDGTLTPFPKKFPAEANFLKKAWQDGKIVVANHGLTHCIVGKHLPKLWRSNRKFHREFFPELGQSWHTEHIIRSQEILESFFGKPVEIFVPPGNLWSIKTYQALKGTNIKKVLCARGPSDGSVPDGEIEFIADKGNSIAFHDRELKLYGASWLRKLIQGIYEQQ